jgi:hypothetical protein
VRFKIVGVNPRKVVKVFDGQAVRGVKSGEIESVTPNISAVSLMV